MLKAQMEQVKRLYIKEEHLKTVLVDRGCRGHDYTGPAEGWVDRRGRGSIPKRIWRWMKPRAAVEPTIGHLKSDYRLDRNRLKGRARRCTPRPVQRRRHERQEAPGLLLAFWLRLLSALLTAFFSTD